MTDDLKLVRVTPGFSDIPFVCKVHNADGYAICILYFNDKILSHSTVVVIYSKLRYLSVLI